MRLLILFYALLISTKIFAQSQSLITSEISLEETSESVVRRNVSIAYESNRHNVFWPYEPEEKSKYDYLAKINYLDMSTNTGDFQGTRALVGMRLNGENKSLDTLVGMHLLNKPSNENINNFSAELLYKHKISKQFLYRILYNYDLFYKSLTLPHLITEDLKSHTISTYFSYSFTKTLRSSLRLKTEFLSDDNRKDLISLATAYQITDIPWFWGGVSVDYDRTEKNVRGYWTPKNQTAFGPFIEFSTLLFKDITLATDISLNRYYVGEYNLWGNGHYAVLKIEKGDRNQLNYGVNVINMRSQEEGATWSSSIGKIFLNYFF